MKKLVFAALCMSLIAACGKRGSPDFPPNSVYPRMYPTPRQPLSVPKEPIRKEKQEPKEADSILEMQKLLESDL